MRAPEHPSPADRIEALDFVRGVAVLGILAINITGFWGPTLSSFSPMIPRAEPGGAAWFTLAFVLFEGKMRALFTLLFGASMMLFCASVERRGRQPELMQARRLLWLGVFGYAHYLLLWWGDILFPYALCGLLALALRRLAPVTLAALGLSIFVLSHGAAMVGDLYGLAAEQRVLAGHASPAEVAEQAGMMQRIAASVADDVRILNAGFVEAVRLRWTTAPFLPFETTLSTLTETFPLMLLGMALQTSGFFAGDWSERALRALAIGTIGIGGALTLALLGWLVAHGWPPRAMFAALGSLGALPHLLMALGYAAGLLLLWPRVADRALARRIVAAGRCAFTNYIGTTALMGAFFSGWGLGLGPEIPRAWLPLFVVTGWLAMVAWPRWWLVRFRQGPLEALWRRLTWLGVSR
ncbi:DUF418 domain-containing protein [Novosphingobium percolationis]|uniref:DUF418 domain-containing protein n=1 Tax=Novosphingobium percolationis TaxID=2871811 RepID=UPI001CD2B925|nr:DUF418 domain-containing protein [Novosphingobium percolationis]